MQEPPPLARDANGHVLRIPDGTAYWRIVRDDDPPRLGLDLTPQQLLALYGPGTYRIEAIDAYGQRLELVTRITVTR